MFKFALKIFSLLILNLFLVILIFISLSFFSIIKIDFGNGIIGRYFRLISTKYLDHQYKSISTYESPKDSVLSLRFDELRKLELELDKKNDLLNDKSKRIDKLEESSRKLYLKLQQKAEELKIMEKRIKSMKNKSNQYDTKVKQIANTLASMNPAKAADILNGLKSVLVLDVIDAMNTYYNTIGEDSAVPYILTLMNIEKVRNIILVQSELSKGMLPNYLNLLKSK